MAKDKATDQSKFPVEVIKTLKHTSLHLVFVDLVKAYDTYET